MRVPNATPLKLMASIPAHKTFLGNQTFSFLNLRQTFEEKIDWNFAEYGKLWTYNLNYFEFLCQEGISLEEGLRLIHDFRDHSAQLRDGIEPFPISLRVMNWVKFISLHHIRDGSIDLLLWQHLHRLSKQPEYHLLGNHLLENGFALLFGACYFGSVPWYRQASQILERELNEQILPDGGHFELSPMYHQLMLLRVLDAINLMRHQPDFGKSNLLELLEDKAADMLGWMQKMRFANGSLPHLNDSAPQIAPDANALATYAERLNLTARHLPLKESGYRKYPTEHYELLMDVGAIGPDYIPGHAHSDTFHFVLHVREIPLLVDTGISTYEKNDRRQRERSTIAHNTVMVQQREQSEVWGGFRVGRRAKIIQLEEEPNRIKATHDGYRRWGLLHSRTFEMQAAAIVITDQLSSPAPARAYLHFHPDARINCEKDRITGTFGEIQFENQHRIYCDTYDYCIGYNLTRTASRIIIEFDDFLITKIQIR